MRIGSGDQTMIVRGSEAATVQTARLLWEACRADPDPAAVGHALDGGADLPRAIAAAAEHRLVPLLWRALAAAGALDRLGAQRDDLAAAADAFRMEALLLIPRAVELAIRPLTLAGLEPVVLKGPEVASRYPGPGLRPMEDIDVLLPQAEHARALGALQRVGWQVARGAGIDLYDTVLTHPEVPSLFLELHYGLERTTQRVTALDPMVLWERRQPTECAGTPAFRLPVTEELVVLAAHAGKPHHRFVRLIWIADLAMVASDAALRGTPVDWDAVRSFARETRCVTVVGVALAMARRAGVEVPQGLFSLPTRGRRGETMRSLSSETWPLTHDGIPGYRLDYALSTTDGRARRMKVLVVRLASGHGIRGRLRGATQRPRRVPGRSEHA
jgi:hypothetical protein